MTNKSHKIIKCVRHVSVIHSLQTRDQAKTAQNLLVGATVVTFLQ